MKHLFLTLGFGIALAVCSYGQTDTTTSVSDKIKMERDSELSAIKDKLKENEIEINRLKDVLAESNNTQSKVANLEKLQNALDIRTKQLETAPKTKIKFNGQLAFIELLSIQRDLQPAQLFASSQAFFTQLGNISNLQNYQSFTEWKTKYDDWYKKQNKDDQMLQLVNNSINLIGDVANQVPLYGSIVQTVTSGISALVSNFSGRHKELKEKTPDMLRLLNAASQFENQKAIIDHEWEQINKELAQLQTENDKLLKDQLDFYGINFDKYSSEYLNATLEIDRDKFKGKCRKSINAKLAYLDSVPETQNNWVGQVETYMYKVQSLRIRFGNLTNRMLSNIDRYEQLIALFSDESKFPKEFTDKIKGLGQTLASVRKNFSATFKPEKYIEDSVVMYIEKE